MVSSSCRLGVPFLLIECPANCVRWFVPAEVIEIVFVPSRADFLRNCQVTIKQMAETQYVPPSSGHETSTSPWLKDCSGRRKEVKESDPLPFLILDSSGHLRFR